MCASQLLLVWQARARLVSTMLFAEVSAFQGQGGENETIRDFRTPCAGPGCREGRVFLARLFSGRVFVQPGLHRLVHGEQIVAIRCPLVHLFHCLHVSGKRNPNIHSGFYSSIHAACLPFFSFFSCQYRARIQGERMAIKESLKYRL